MKVLVIGGTGAIGGEVTKSLYDRGVSVRCMSRFANKLKSLPPVVEGRVGDLEKPASLSMVFDGVDKVFLMTPLSRKETQLGLAAVEAAKAAGVRHLVYMSAAMPAGAEHVPHFKNKVPIEQAIKHAEFDWTILRPNNFFQNDSLWCRAAVMSYGVYPQPIGSVGINRVDIRDVAVAAATALTEPGHEGAEYPLHGPDVLTGEAVAAIFGKHLGRPIAYAGNDLEEWSRQARHMMPEWMVKDLRDMYDSFQRQGLIATEQELRMQDRILKRPPRRFDAFVGEVVPAWQREIEIGDRR